MFKVTRKNSHSAPDIRIWDLPSGDNDAMNIMASQKPLLQDILSKRHIKSADVLPALPYLTYAPDSSKQYSMFVEPASKATSLTGQQTNQIENAILKLVKLKGDIHLRTPDLKVRILQHGLKPHAQEPERKRG